jgi:hypothetical protein
MSAPTGWTPLEQAPQGDGRHWLWPVSIVALVLLLLLSIGGGALLVLDRQRDIRALERELEAARTELERTREELADARADDGDAPVEGAPGGGLGGILDGLFGDEGGLDLGGLLEQFGGGGLDGILEGAGGNAALFACLSGAGVGGGAAEPITGSDAQAQVAAITERVEGLRELRFDGDLDTTFLPTADFEDRVRKQFDADYGAEDADVDRRILVGLGAVPRAFDLRERFLDLISGQAAGFYDPRTREIVVRADPDGALSPAEQLTLAHEIEHALSDERLGLPDREDAADDVDGARASLALVEGGATLVMQQYASSALGVGDQLRMATDPAVAQAQRQLQTFPHHLQRDLQFPYEDGLAFTCGIHSDGGWRAVDAAYADLPTTTAQILWPERYRSGEGATAPRAFAATPPGWTEARTTTLGAAELLWLLEAPGGDTAAALDDPLGRTAAWDGGALRLLTRGDDSALAVALVQRDGEPDLCATMADWYRAAFPGDREVPAGSGERLVVDGAAQDAVLACDGDEVRLGIAPDLATARALGG